MRENRTCGSEGGEAQSLPYPYPPSFPFPGALPVMLSGFICFSDGVDFA